jgi:glycosyltransferase involved in cell wall biosynthesis
LALSSATGSAGDSRGILKIVWYNLKMRVGIAGPLELSALSEFLPQASSQQLSLGLGGTAVTNLVDGFLRSGHEVTVFTLDPRVREKQIVQGPSLKVIFGHFRTSRLKALDFCYREFQQIRNFITEEVGNIDVVNAHWSYEFAIGALLSPVPTLVTFRDHALSILRLTKDPYRITRLLMDQWVRRNGKYFSYNSEYLKDLVRVPGLVIPNPVREKEIGAARSLAVDNKIKRICFVANGWDYRKNPETALKAFALLRRELADTELHLIGGGYEAAGPKYLKMEKLKLNDGVIYRGKISHTALMAELPTFDLMLHTSREESFGNNLVEAMAKGVPVVGGRGSGNVPFVLDGGKAGRLVDVENPEEIAAVMKALLTSREEYQRLSQAAVESVRRRFAQRAVCGAYLAAYEQVLQDPRSSKR